MMDLGKNYRLFFILYKELLKTGKKKTYNTMGKWVENNSCKNSEAIHLKRFSHW